jgi:hypothetical protein
MPLIVQAQNNETPDSTQSFTAAVNGNNNTSHGSTNSNVIIGAEDSADQSKTCRWFNFQNILPKSVRLKFNWSASGSVEIVAASPGSTQASASFVIQYSVDGGVNWITAASAGANRNSSGNTPFSDGGSVDIVISAPQTGQVQIRDRIFAGASSTLDPTVSATADVTASIDSIQLEVEPKQVFRPICIM